MDPSNPLTGEAKPRPSPGQGAETSMSRGACVTIGNFDGVHLGHQALIGHAAKLASRTALDLILITFWPHPRMVLPNAPPHRPLTEREDKMRLLAALGAENIMELPFTHSLSALTPEQFIREYLLPLDLRQLVVGHDFTLGRKREGDISVLRQLGSEMGFSIDRIEPLSLNGEPVSSTRLRERIAAGAVKAAADLLGRFHTVRGTVMHGDARGTSLGFPTANLGGFETLLPANGVYATRVILEGRHYPSITNIGKNPTFNGEELRVETHLLDLDRDLYGTELEIEFIDRVRDEKKFADPSGLAAQIGSDITVAREILSRT